MDQHKPSIVWLRKYHFWVLTGLAVIVGLGVWFLAASDLQARYDSRKQKLDGDFQQMQGIQNEADHPNEKVVQEVQNQHEAVKKNVLDAWTLLHKEQESKNPWPRVLGADFLNFITTQPRDAEIPTHLREIYLNYIAEWFPETLKLIDVRRPKPGSKAAEKVASGDAVRAETEGKTVEYTGTVFWEDNNLKAIQERFKWSSVPSTLEVRLAQEDLWVYEALLRIIKNTNEGTRDYYKAPVRRIEAVEIGQGAAAAWAKVGGAVVSFGESTVAGAGPEGGAPPGPEGGATPGAEPPAAAAPGEPAQGVPMDAVSRTLLDRRYVDAKGQPLAAGAPHPYPEFKMMPVRLKLLMNQMQLAKLLAQCANSNMPVEVRLVRVRPDDSGGAAPGVSSGAPTGGPAGPPEPGAAGTGGPGGPGGAPPAGPEGQPRTSGEAGREELTHSLYVPVEILGIIYIYNPPDQAKLRPGGQTGEAGQPATSAPAAGPEAAAGGVAPATAPPPAAPAAARAGAPVAPAAPAPIGNPAPGAPAAPATPPAGARP